MGLEAVEVGQRVLEQETMGRLDPSVERLPQERALRAYAPARQLGERVGLPAPGQDGFEPIPPARAPEVGGDGAERAVGALHDLLEAGDLLRPRVEEFWPIPGQLAPPSERLRRDEAGVE